MAKISYQSKKRAILVEMLTENTGINFLDSGGVYGRHWEQNQRVDFNASPMSIVSVDTHPDYGGIDVSMSAYHFLAEMLRYDADCERMQKELDAFAETSAMRSEGWLAVMEAFASATSEKHTYETVNSYNYGGLLSQVIQYVSFYHQGAWYYLLQIHGGCDVRGGYTRPRVFKVLEEDDYMLGSDTEFSVSFGDDLEMYTDDGGGQWFESKTGKEVTRKRLLAAVQPYLDHAALIEKSDALKITNDSEGNPRHISVNGQLHTARFPSIEEIRLPIRSLENRKLVEFT